ncbi:MAG: hypothetical protein RL701_154 [Pseudomonadota bacterium]
MRTLLWYRGKDLRVHDHAALFAAARDSREVIPVFVLDSAYLKAPPTRHAPHRVQFLLAALRELGEALQARGSQLLLVHGPAGERIPELAKRVGAERVFAIADCEPNARERDERIRAALAVPFTLFQQQTLTDPDAIQTAGGTPFRVFTPFSRAAFAQLNEQKLLAAPTRLPPFPKDMSLPRQATLPTLQQLGIAENEHVQPGGEEAGRARLREFLGGPVADYEHDRDRMDRSGTSRLSADLHFGTLSARSIWVALDKTSERKTALPEASLLRYRTELLWRDFAHYTLWHRPSVLTEPFRPEFKGFPWLDAASDFAAWWRGTTGYPVVDAAARQLLEEGFVHNRARMISASFLTKHLLTNYQHGEAHYLQFLTDGDLAQNNLGWQWSAGCGCDAQPYFRIFNPVTQGERFDPDGEYVRKYVRELAPLPTRYLHAPWTAPADVLKKAGIRLGKDYPEPIVDHASARKRFLLVAGDHLKRGV